MNNETTISLRDSTSGMPNTQKFRALLDILVAFTPIIVLGGLGSYMGTGTLPGGMLVSLGYVLSVVISSFVLKMRGTNWREIGLGQPQSWGRTAMLGIGTLLLALVVNIAVQVIALNLPGAEIAQIDESRFNPLTGNLPFLLLYVVLAWTTIAFGEEMMYRAFLMDRLGSVFQNSKLRWPLALLGSSLIFGCVHLVEGPLGVINTFAMGLLLGAVYLRSGRNLWVTIIAHGSLNTLRFVLLFVGV